MDDPAIAFLYIFGAASMAAAAIFFFTRPASADGKRDEMAMAFGVVLSGGAVAISVLAMLI